MKALVLNGKDQPLQIENVEMPVLTDAERNIAEDGKGYEIVKLKAAALNHRDVWIQKGQYAGLKYPCIIGSDGAGTTAEGKAVIINPSLFWGADQRTQSRDFRILGLPDDGTFAEYIKIPKANLAVKPKHLSFEQAAALPLAGLTAYRALCSRCQVQPMDKVLISGIGGGVALFAMQFAVALGCDVWVTSSSETKIEHAKALGAKGGFLYNTEGWSKAAQTEMGGFDVVIDGASGSGFAELVKACRPAARLCFYGGTAGILTGISPQVCFYKQLSIFGSTMGSAEEFAKMVKFVGKYKIIPIVDEVFEFENGNAAMVKMDKGAQFGKLVIRIA